MNWGNIKLSQEFVAGAGVSILGVFLGDWDTPLRILLILMAVDVLSGCFKGWYLNQFSSREFRKGLMTKAGFFLVLILAYQIDVLMQNTEPVVRTAVATAYIVVEGTSLLENLAQIGVPIPKFLTDRLGALKMDEEKKVSVEEK